MRGEIWMELKADYQKGLSYSELSRKYNIDRRTAKKYAQSDRRREYVLTDSKPSELDLYKTQISIWLEKAPMRAVPVSICGNLIYFLQKIVYIFRDSGKKYFGVLKLL